MDNIESRNDHTPSIDELQKEIRMLEKSLALAELKISKTQQASAAMERIEKNVHSPMEKERQFFHFVLGNATNIIMLFDPDGCFAYVSDTFLRDADIADFGLINGRHFRDVLSPIINPNSLNRLSEAIDSAIAQKNKVSLEERIDFNNKGLPRVFSINIMPMLCETDKHTGIMVLFNDISYSIKLLNDLEKRTAQLETTANALESMKEIQRRNGQFCMRSAENMPEHTGDYLIEQPRFYGLILVCEDSPMNQQVIRQHFARVGLRTMVAENGKVGIEMVQERIQKKQKPFDMIFMDIFMPVMGGVEAASKIDALGTKIPIVAVTANAMDSDLDTYKKSGMCYCIGKPFSEQELWRCLLKHLTPVSVSPVNAIDQAQDNDILRKKLKASFIKNNRTKYDEITKGIEAGDIALAHRLAHTLRGNAGMIGKSELQNVAAEIEATLNGGAKPTAEQMKSLETELNTVLGELMPLFDEPEEQAEREFLPLEQILTLLTKLEFMLKRRNPECLDLLEDILSIPGAGDLARHMEKYDFKFAAQALDELKKEWTR